MSSKYYVAKFMEDLARRETKNIGVFYVTESGISAKFLGEKANGTIDLRTVRSLIQHTPTYKQWIGYWRDALTQTKSSEEILAEVMSSARGNFVIEEGQGLFLPKATSQSKIDQLDYLYKLIVDEFSQDVEGVSVQRSLSQRCDEIIRHYDLRRDPHFHESPTIPITIDGAPRHIRPSYRWLNGRDIYFQKVSIDETRLDPTQRDVTSAAWMFERLKEANQHSETKALVKFSRRDDGNATLPVSGQAEYADLLASVSDAIIDVDDDAEVDRFFSQLH